MPSARIKEEAIKRAVSRYMDSHGYKVKDSRAKHEPGWDLIFSDRRNGRTISVEAKGETGAKSEMETKILSGLGQIVSKFKKHPNHIFALAIPLAWRERVYRKIGPDAMSALNLHIYLVNAEGNVTRITRRNYLREFEATDAR